MPGTVRSSTAAIAVYCALPVVSVLLTAAGLALVLSMSAPPIVAGAGSKALCRRFPVEPPSAELPAVAMAATTQLSGSWVVTLLVAVVEADAVKAGTTFPRLTTPEYDATAATISVPVQQVFTLTQVLLFAPAATVDHSWTLA